MSEKPDNPPAFPVDCNTDSNCRAAGMRLRDYFAIRCPDSEIEGLVWGEVKKMFGLSDNHRGEESDLFQKARCVLRYRYADAMLKARESRGGN